MELKGTQKSSHLPGKVGSYNNVAKQLYATCFPVTFQLYSLYLSSSLPQCYKTRAIIARLGHTVSRMREDCNSEKAHVAKATSLKFASCLLSSEGFHSPVAPCCARRARHIHTYVHTCRGPGIVYHYPVPTA